MASRASLNKVLLIGNLTRDPELRYTPSGAAVCSFTIATNRSYVASDGNRKEETEFSRAIAWNKLGELCSQLLAKGRKVYVEGRLQTRSWETPDGQSRQQTEIVIDDMRILDSKKSFEESRGEGTFDDLLKEPSSSSDDKEKSEKSEKKDKAVVKEDEDKKTTKSPKDKETDSKKGDKKEEDEVDLDDLPF